MKKIIISGLFCLVTVYAFGQDFCWYLFEKKKCYEVSATKMLVKSEKENTACIKKALTNTVAGSLKKIDYLSDGVFMVEIQHSGKENMLELQHQCSAIEGVLSVSPVFFDEFGDEAGGYANEVVVMLKSKDDYAVLQKCAEVYQINDIRPHEFDELKYTLTLPRNARKNALQIANELYETGFFYFSEPNFILFARTDSNDYPDRRELRNENSPFTVYPVPAGDVLYVDINRQVADSPSCEFHIYSLNGSKALQTAANGNEVRINVSVLQNGIYFLHVYDISNGKQETKKIVIKH
ncbi:MAG: T9SS type A sorting domain-containing protein [Tannerella sp.]|jgi:nitrate reductase NapAB chaperone NapD|nr:T9SS type A sorting domain-containing protein [Tannerella sp.]